MNNSKLIIHTDGGSRGNPGPAACAFTAEIDGKIVDKGSLFLGTQTNNIAEYEGVILALNWLTKNIDNYKISIVNFILDSELVVRQLNGVYKIKNKLLFEKSIQIKKIISNLKISVIFENVPRENNKEPDKLLNEELDKYFSG